MIAVYVHPGVGLAGRFHSATSHARGRGTSSSPEPGEDRSVLTPGEGRALVQAGFADAIGVGFAELADLIDDWQRAERPVPAGRGPLTLALRDAENDDCAVVLEGL